MQNQDSKLSTPQIFVLNCGTQGCCPEIEINENEVLIKDDFGGKVILNFVQWNDLIERVKKEEITKIG